MNRKVSNLQRKPILEESMLVANGRVLHRKSVMLFTNASASCPTDNMI